MRVRFVIFCKRDNTRPKRLQKENQLNMIILLCGKLYASLYVLLKLKMRRTQCVFQVLIQCVFIYASESIAPNIVERKI